MISVKNKRLLIENGKTELTKKARKLALDSIEHAINSVDPKKLVASKLVLSNSQLKIDGHSFNLDIYTHIFVVGGGKASGAMAEAIEDLLGNRITAGVINVPYGNTNKTKIVKLNQASHPLPDTASIEGTRQMLAFVEKADADDLVICLVSGGGSSLMSFPRKGISLEDKRDLTVALLRSGATINEINTVRKHLSGFKGGWFAKKAYPATVLSIILSDVVGDSLDVISSGPTVADSTTFADARKVLESYGLWNSAPSRVREVLIDGEKGLIEETPKPKDEAFANVYNVIVGNNRLATLAACQYLKSQGLNTLLLTSTLDGEAKCVGKALSAIANEILTSNNPVPKPAAIIAGGETTVKVMGQGLGGRNQELVLSASLKLKGSADQAVVVASAGTDGVDGPTDAAGAIADANTSLRAQALKLKAENYLAENDSYRFFSKLQDLIVTGQTGVNVNDISLIIVL